MSEMSKTNGSKVSKRGNGASPKYGINSSFTGLSVGYNIKSLTAELEKRRAELIALARMAEARAREAEEKCEQVETRLERETNQRLLAEQRLRELEEERLRQLQAAEIEGAKTLKAALAHGEVEARLKQAEGRVKETENEALALALALAEAEQKRAETEAAARAAEEKTYEMERALRDAEESHRQQEDDLKNLLQKQEAKLRSMPEQIALLNSVKSVNKDHTYGVEKQKGMRHELNFIIYGMVIMLLLVAVCGLVIAAYLKT